MTTEQTLEVVNAPSTEDENVTSTAHSDEVSPSTNGLSQEEAKQRLDKYGYNELSERKVNPLLKLLSYFWGPIPWMIEAAAILSALLQHWPDFAIISTLLAANALVGFWEEYQAGNAIAALKKSLALRARVKRDGAWSTIPARELVPGDLIRLRIGDIVPADCELLEGEPLQVDQSALTGESLPVTHEQGEDIYSGAVVRQGEANAITKATGANTFFGKTTHLVETAQQTSHFQRAVLKIGNFLIVLAVALVMLILTVSLLRGDPLMTTLQFALVLTVAAIPVALPTVLSVTMAVGAKILSKADAIVSRLTSIEELAGMDVLCSDKTGTLTQNRLSLGEPFTVNGTSPRQIIQCSALASRAEDQDPIDMAVLGGAREMDAESDDRVVDFVPFDPVHKRTEATIATSSKGRFQVTKGAPQVILELASNADDVRPEVQQAIDDFAARGFRSLGVARTNEQGDWQFLGVLPLLDPPREDSAETVRQARAMGCRIKMITGDQTAIGKEIARRLGLGTNIQDASRFSETGARETEELAEEIERADGFAQVFPEHKYRIIDVLQQRGHFVGMTGDGVNDAPALKKANVGIAVSGATDAARAAADMVLLSPGLSVIIKAIEESRKIFQRMTNYAVYRIAETIRVLLFMTLSILIFNFYPVTAVMIVLLALLNDGAILSIAYDRVQYSKRPETWDMTNVLGLAAVLGLLGVIASFGLFYLAERVFDLSPNIIQSLMYLKLSVAGHLTVFVTRTRGPFWSSKPAPILFWAVLGTQLLATLIAVYGLFMTPIGWSWALVVWGYALGWFVVNDFAKQATVRFLEARKPPLSAGKELAEN